MVVSGDKEYNAEQERDTSHAKSRCRAEKLIGQVWQGRPDK
jgi:hypothetical protein